MRAASRQRARSCVVKPSQPHWFFISSKMFSPSPLAIELTERLGVLIERGDENRVFVDIGRLADLGEGDLRRPGLVLPGKPHGPSDGA